MSANWAILRDWQLVRSLVTCDPEAVTRTPPNRPHDRSGIMTTQNSYRIRQLLRHPGLGWAISLTVLPVSAFAQASPWLTGANSLVTNLQAWALPLTILGIMVVALFAMAGNLQGRTALFMIVGIVLLFGAPQVVGWVRGMFAV
jgi:type IV secretion system protein VirB2